MLQGPIKNPVHNRGVAPDKFLLELITWGKSAADEIFAYNTNPSDVYSSVYSRLGPYNNLLMRKAVMLEVLRVLAGFESTWSWTEGRDITNSTSNTSSTEETGAFQVSANSQLFGKDLRQLVYDFDKDGDTDNQDFLAAMKLDHKLALEYIARLLRHTCRHNGPVLRHEIDPWLSPAAVKQFMALLLK